MGLLRSALATLAGKMRATGVTEGDPAEDAATSGNLRAASPRALADAGRLVEAIAMCDDPQRGTSVERAIDLAYVLRCWGRHLEAARALEHALGADGASPDALSLAALI